MNNHSLINKNTNHKFGEYWGKWKGNSKPTNHWREIHTYRECIQSNLTPEGPRAQRQRGGSATRGAVAPVSRFLRKKAVQTELNLINYVSHTRTYSRAHARTRVNTRFYFVVTGSGSLLHPPRLDPPHGSRQVCGEPWTRRKGLIMAPLGLKAIVGESKSFSLPSPGLHV